MEGTLYRTNYYYNGVVLNRLYQAKKCVIVGLVLYNITIILSKIKYEDKATILWPYKGFINVSERFMGEKEYSRTHLKVHIIQLSQLLQKPS